MKALRSGVERGNDSLASKPRLQRLLWVGGLIVCLFYFLYRGVYRYFYDVADFSGVYVATCMWKEGVNPYRLSDLQDAYAQLKQHSRSSSVYPNVEANPMVYLPATYLVLVPLSLADWAGAKLLWGAVLLFSVFVLLLAVFSLDSLSRKQKCVFLFSMLSFSPLHSGLSKGQLGVLVSILCILVVILNDKLSERLKLALLVIAIGLKPTIAIPILAAFVIQGQIRLVFRALFYSLLITALSCYHLLLIDSHWLTAFFEMFTFANKPGGINCIDPSNPSRSHLLNAAPLLYDLSCGRLSDSMSTGVVLALGGLALMVVRQRRPEKLKDLVFLSALLSTFGILAVYHRYYDATVLLLCEIFFLYNLKKRSHFFFISSFVFPLQSLFSQDKLGIGLIMSKIDPVFVNFSVIKCQTWLLFALIIVILYSVLRKES